MSAAQNLRPVSDGESLIRNYLERNVSVQCQVECPHFHSDQELVAHIEHHKNKFFEDPLHILRSFPLFAEWQPRGIQDKNDVLDGVRNFLNGAVNASLMDDILQCADELITNGIFNAPAMGIIDRKNLDFTLPDKKNINFGLAHNEAEIFFLCADPFGTLNVRKFFERILNCHVNGLDSSINYGVGGSGIGSFMIFDQVSSMIVGVKPNIRTIVGCKFPKKLGSKKRKISPKNLIIFNEGA